MQSHPVTGQAILGFKISHFFDQALALGAHGAFPINRILGWDIALTAQGACLIECNKNTGHSLFQYAFGRGVLNADFRPVFGLIIARNARIDSVFDAKRKAHRDAKARF